LLLVFGASYLNAQQSTPNDPVQREVEKIKGPGDSVRQANERLKEVATGKIQMGSDYRVGPGDLLEFSVFEVPELSKTVRVSASGEISLPLIGKLPAAGFSPIQLEQRLRELLRVNYVKDPQVTVFIKEFHSDPVSLLGAVKMPGLYYIQTAKSLVEVLA